MLRETRESGTHPFTTTKDETRQEHGSSRDLAGWELQEAVVETANLEQVLADSTRLNVIAVCLGDATKEVHWVGVAKVVVEGLKNKTLSREDLLLGEAVISDVTEVLDVW